MGTRATSLDGRSEPDPRTGDLGLASEVALGLAHDLNNQLLAMVGFAEIAMRALDDESPAREALEVVRDLGGQASDILRRMLDVRRGTLARMREVDCRDLLLSAAASVWTRARSDIQVVLSLPAAPLVVQGDAVLLREALANLVRNAVQAMPQGGRVLLSGAHGDAGDAGDAGDVLLHVRDEGTGIPDHRLEHVFEPLETTRCCEGGFGLGLASVRATALLHRGAVEVESRPGVGSTFTLRLPAPN